MEMTFPPAINPKVALAMIDRFLVEELAKTGLEGFVVGLSGGIDSALSCALAVHAVGKDSVRALKMPYRTSSPASEADADALVEMLGVETERIDITPMVDGYFDARDDATALRRGNYCARARMACLFDVSAREKALVLGTSNKTELLLGYGTWYGDVASSLNPIGDLYKTQVRQLARFLNIPKAIIEKPPSADLWPDQTDEDELGVSYEDADAILYRLVDERFTVEEVAAAGFERSLVERVLRMVERSQFKRRLPLIAKLSQRTIGIDFRYPRDWGR